MISPPPLVLSIQMKVERLNNRQEQSEQMEPSAAKVPVGLTCNRIKSWIVLSHCEQNMGCFFFVFFLPLSFGLCSEPGVFSPGRLFFEYINTSLV